MVITAEEIGFFERMYYEHQLFPHQRYGQAFCNWFSVTNSEIFYNENEIEVREIVWNLAK